MPTTRIRPMNGLANPRYSDQDFPKTLMRFSQIRFRAKHGSAWRSVRRTAGAWIDTPAATHHDERHVVHGVAWSREILHGAQHREQNGFGGGRLAQTQARLEALGAEFLIRAVARFEDSV